MCFRRPGSGSVLSDADHTSIKLGLVELIDSVRSILLRRESNRRVPFRAALSVLGDFHKLHSSDLLEVVLSVRNRGRKLGHDTGSCLHQLYKQHLHQPEHKNNGLGCSSAEIIGSAVEDISPIRLTYGTGRKHVTRSTSSILSHLQALPSGLPAHV